MGTLASRKALSSLTGVLLSAVLEVALPVCVYAADESASPESEAPQLSEIVVTAQRRTENLQNVPVSVQVIGGQTLAAENLNSLGDLAQTTPALHVSAGGATSDMYIRGIGSGNQQSFDQSVGTFSDDIYHGRARSSTATFLDLERIEVLKGPQSTFFGNNAIAGALNIVTRKPTDTFDASARVLYGQDGQYAFEAAVGGPITDALSVRLAGIVDGQRGWIKDVATDDFGPKEYNDGGRITLAFRPSTDFDATLKFEASRNRESGDLDLQVANCPPQAPLTAGQFCQSALSQHVPVYPVGRLGTLEADVGGQGTFLSTFETALTLNYHLWDQTFSSVTGYYNYNYNQDLDLDGTPLGLATAQAPEQYNQFSQEFRVASATGGRFEYLAGAYLQIDHLDYQQFDDFPFANPKFEAVPAFAPLLPYLPVSEGYFYSQPEHVYSVFGSASWNITDLLKLTGSVRGSQVEKSYDRTFAYGTATQTYGGFVALPAALQGFPEKAFAIPPGTLSGDRTDRDWMPSAKLQYQIDPSAMAYVSFTQGFKAGGFNGSDTTGLAANMPYAPEHVNAYEAGIKSKWLDDTVLINLDVFRSNYRNLQVVVEEGYQTASGVAVVRNAAASRSQGVEFEGQWVTSRYFRLSADATYLDSHYIDYANAAPNGVQAAEGLTVQNLSGRPTEYAPRISGNVTGTFTTPLPNGMKFTAALSPFFTSGYYLLASEDAAGHQPGYMQLDARLTLETSDGRWALDVIGKNLTDRQILTYSTIEPTSPGSYLVSQAQGSNVAAQIRFHW
jgi:iron complex outermembrane recepter protein